jgi:hypothetical protein
MKETKKDIKRLIKNVLSSRCNILNYFAKSHLFQICVPCCKQLLWQSGYLVCEDVPSSKEYLSNTAVRDRKRKYQCGYVSAANP